MTTIAERRHMSKVAELGCILCRRNGYMDSPAELHHPRTGVGAGRRSSHMSVIPLCTSHHRSGPTGLHVLGRKAFERIHGITELELLEETRRLLGIEHD